MAETDNTTVGEIAQGAVNLAEAVAESMGFTTTYLNQVEAQVVSMFGESSPISSSITGMLGRVSGSFQQLKGIATDSFGGVEGAVSSLFQNMGNLDTDDSVEGALRLTQTLSSFKTSALSSKEAFGTMGESASSSITQVTSSIERLQTMGAIPSAIAEAMKASALLADGARALDANIIALNASTGTLSMLQRDGVISATLLDAASSNWNSTVVQSANALGLTVQQVQGMAKELAVMPDLLTDTSDSATGMGAALERTTAISRVFGMTNQEIVGMVKEQYLRFGTSVSDATDNVAMMGAASQNLRIPISILKTYLEGVSDQTGIMGNNAESAVRVFTNMGSRLAEVGVSSTGAASMITSMVKGVTALDLGTEAFINRMSGGTGGITGGLEIEMLKMQGKTDEVLARTQTALENMMGGSVVTLQQAIDNPALQGQLLQQVELLKQFKLAADAPQAYKLLEAMQSGGSIDLTATVESPQEAMDRTMSSSVEIQTRMANSLVQINNSIQAWTQGAARGALDLQTTVLGSTRSQVRGGLEAANTGSVASSEGAVRNPNYTVPSIEGVGQAIEDRRQNFTERMGLSIPQPAPAAPPQRLSGTVNVNVTVNDQNMRAIAREEVRAMVQDGVFTGG